MSADGEGANLARSWSSRRARVAEAEREALEAAEREATRSEREAREAAERERNRLAAEAIDIDAIDASSDIGAFLKEGVPAALKRRALRTMWRSDPVFSNLDRLNEYDENFRDPSRTLATLQSAWQAGRGYLFDDEPDTDDQDGEAQGEENEGQEIGGQEIGGHGVGDGTDGDLAKAEPAEKPDGAEAADGSDTISTPVAAIEAPHAPTEATAVVVDRAGARAVPEPLARAAATGGRHSLRARLGLGSGAGQVDERALGGSRD